MISEYIHNNLAREIFISLFPFMRQSLEVF
jgi:hypothetical protein